MTMDRTRAASDKIRPFLEAMERSIDQVRRKRMQDAGEMDVPQELAPSPRPSSPSEVTSESLTHRDPPKASPLNTQVPPATNSGDAPPPRLKARPKRPTAFTNNAYDQENYRSQAS